MKRTRMPQRLKQQFRRLDALIRVYSPPRQARVVFWDPADLPASSPSVATDSGEQPSTNACNSRSSQQQVPQEDRDGLTAAPSRREIKQQAQRRWVGSVVEALSDVFSAIWTNFIETSAEFQQASQLRPGSGGSRPGTDAKLVSNAFSSDQLMSSRPSFRIHFRLLQEFSNSHALTDWENNAAVNAYIEQLKFDPMITECCTGLFNRLDVPTLQTVDSFVRTLRQVWFQPLETNAGQPRCGYHHVCIGEFHSRSKSIGGMHNWFKYLLEEEKHNTRILNWWSYEKDLHLISMKFNMKHPDFDAWYTKEKSSFLVGVPTDFELLLFTVVTMVNPNRDTSIQIKDYEPLVVVPRSLKKTGSLVTAYFRESPKRISG
ncbi:hypothetical protein BOX15_Mlig033690g3 [Macrostomum lignano]|uniref:Uridylate-specific endoribonuclease n=2 Tax=Macrostomum lignano TaxID=282301 RepID=A0A1I8GJ70_9PLAT|nr:hypothetical protein BOX15_Mlig033690g3 [Macrostomum lignano]